MILYLKNGNKIHIKKKNRGKFTAYCGGNVTSACIAKAKASGNPTLIKRATFALNARHFKHRLGGSIVEAFKLYSEGFKKGGSIKSANARKWKHQQGGTILPEVTVVPNKLFLYTYYPVINSRYPFTGHSELRVSTPDYFRDMGNGYAVRVEGTSAHINKKMEDNGYNLVTNNCADATRCALETISGKKMNPYFFTTPGDVLDFFKENFDIRKVKNNGKRRGQETWYTNITPLLAEIIKNQLYELIQENKKDRLKLLANARKWKHQEGGTIKLQAESINNREKEISKQLLKTPTLPNLFGAIYHAYNGWIDPVSPYITGLAPVVSKGTKAIQSVANIKDKGLAVTRKTNMAVKNGLTYDDFDARHVNAGRNRYTKALRERAQYMITNSYPNTWWNKLLKDIFKKQAISESKGKDISPFRKLRYNVLDDFINSGYFR